MLRYCFVIIISFMLIMVGLNVPLAETAKPLRARLLAEVKSEDLIKDSTKFKNASNLSKPIYPFNSKSDLSSKHTDSMTAIFRLALLIPIKFHQKVITHQDGQLCTFRPTCSQYGYEAIKRHGLLGILMTSDRLLRCYRGNQKYYPTIGQFSYDPVP